MKVEAYRVLFKSYLLGPVETKIGCVDGVGACDEPICDAIRGPIFCPLIQRANYTCSCPVPAKTYEAYNVTVSLQNSKIKEKLTPLTTMFTKVRVDFKNKNLIG